MSLYFKLLEKLYPKNRKKPDFTPQFQLRGISRIPNNTDSLAMRTADPLWMLGRQWQFGEFEGEDNGSPINVKTFYRKEQAEYYSNTKDKRHAILEMPLEAKVEAITIKTLDLKSKVRIGQQFERLIKQQFPKPKASTFIHDLRIDFPLQKETWANHDLRKENGIDEKSARFLRNMESQVIDGNLLLNNIANQSFPKKTGSNFNFSKLDKVTNRLKTWHKDLFVQESPEQTWQSHHLAHQFQLHLKKNPEAEDFTLTAPDYQSGHLDWYTFDTAEIKLDFNKKSKETAYQQPVNVSFPSMPDKRLFSFEDSKIDLSLMDVKATDLLKLMIVDFSLVSGSDWYTVPMEMKLGELCWIEKITVKDVFGVTTTIINDGEKGARLDPNPLKVWDIFKIRNQPISTYKENEHFLFLAPTSTHRMESEPTEELLFLRDEYANMIWALERRIPNALGKPVDGYDLHLELYGPFQEETEKEEGKGEVLSKFRLANTVPSNWIPFLPQHIGNDKENIELVRAYMLRNEADNEPTDIKPLTYLAAEDIIKVREEAIPRAGVRVQLTKQRVRWTNGKTYVWMGRKVLVGRGEGNSGLRFDYLKS